MDDHQQVLSGGQKMLIYTKEFPYDPLDPVSPHRWAYFFAGDYAEPGLRQLVRFEKKEKMVGIYPLLVISGNRQKLSSF